jgi:PAS domain S-box-containing protein
MDDENLRQSEERFGLLVQSVRDYAIFMLDPDGRVVSWNQGAQRLKGYRADEIIGQHFSRFYPPEDARRGKCERLLAAAIADGAVEDEGWRVRKDGTRFWADVVITVLHTPDGELRGFAKVTRDLTERKRAEDSLRDVLEREREVAAGLRAMDKTKDEILSVVAHDLRGPLTVLDGLLDLLDSNWDTVSSEEKHDAIRRMIHSTARLRGLVNDVMDVTRIDTGDLRYEIAAFDADVLAAGMVADVADSARIRVEPSERGSAMAWGDERRAWQVLANLLSNALKFSPAASPVHLRVIDANAGEVHFQVEDHGPGVAPEDLHRIFEKFSRAGAPAASGEGTGLGLYIAQSLARGQGGRIQVDSELGNGSTFTLVLPKAGGDVRSAAADEVDDERGGPRLLHPVDDPPSSERREAHRGRRRRSVARAD